MLGVADSEIAFGFEGRCTRFVTDVHIDDSSGDAGSVTFEVLGDGVGNDHANWAGARVTCD